MKSKKLSLMSVLLIALMVFLLTPIFLIPAFAVIPSNVLVTNSAGTITWTNNTAYSAIRADVLRFDLVQPADATATLKRVNAEGFTNALGTVVIASGAGSLADTNVSAFGVGDKLIVTGMGTNSVGRLNFEFNIYP